MQTEPVKILLVEDTLASSPQLHQILAELANVQFQPLDISQSSNLVDQSIFQAQIILVDLAGQVTAGFSIINELYRQAPEIPILVLLEPAQDSIIDELLQAGAWDYFLSTQLETKLLTYIFTHAIEQHRRFLQFESAPPVGDLTSLERLSAPPPTQTTAQSFGQLNLALAWPDKFETLVQEYSGILDLALEQRGYKAEGSISDNLRALANKLGFLKTGPRDVIEIHTAALKKKLLNSNRVKTGVYKEESRLAVLELMGYLVNYYRHRYYLASPYTPAEPTQASTLRGNEHG